MRCELRDVVPVERWAVFAEVAWLERRPELSAICRAARDAGRRITAAVVAAALPGVKPAGARNVVAWCAEVGLCDAAGALTPGGDRAADGDEVPVPEQGVFDLWLVDHPLLGRRALQADRVTAKVDGRFEDITALPTAPERRRAFPAVASPGERFEVRALLPNDAAPTGLPRDTEARCEVRWSLDFTARRERWTLSGAIDGPERSPRPIRHEPESAGVDLDRVLADWASGPLAAFGRWVPDTHHLARGFAGLSEAEQERFLQRLALPEVEVHGRGRWKGVTLDDVPIAPATADDAARWAEARLDRRLRAEPRYRTRDAVRGLFTELTEATPLAALRPALPPHDAMLARYAEAPEVFWSLAAPVDLAPTPTAWATPQGEVNR